MSSTPRIDAGAYPSVSTIYRPEPSVPSAPPVPQLGVEWRDTVEVREFQGEGQLAEQPWSPEPAFLLSMPLQTSLRILRVLVSD